MDLAPQTIALIVVNVILLITFIIGVVVVNKSKKNNEDGTQDSKIMILAKNLGVFALFIIIMCAQGYSVNCMVFGNCATWSWVVASVIMCASFVHMGMLVYVILKTLQSQAAYPR